MARYVPKVDYGRLEFEYVPSSGFYRARISTDNSFKKDTDYAVVFDGRRYTVRSTANGAIGGNAYLYDQRKPDTGEPFYLAPAMGLVMASTAGFHSVSYGIMKADDSNVDERLDGLEDAVVELSEEIGASVPVIQTATVGQTIAVKAVDENGKPIEWGAVDANSAGGSQSSGIRGICFNYDRGIGSMTTGETYTVTGNHEDMEPLTIAEMATVMSLAQSNFSALVRFRDGDGEYAPIRVRYHASSGFLMEFMVPAKMTSRLTCVGLWYSAAGTITVDYKFYMVGTAQ